MNENRDESANELIDVCSTDDRFWEWISSHASDDPAALRLKYAGAGSPFDLKFAITQVECRRKFGKKLADTLAADPRFIFPDRLVCEQSTSDRLAAYHSGLVADGSTLVDLTAGLGIDAFHCARRCSRVVAVEIDPERAHILALNANSLGHHCDFEVVCDDCRSFVDSSVDVFDNAFIDPARRDCNGQRVFALSDCTPDVTAMLPALSSLCRTLIVKMSPMLDITHTVKALGSCSRIIALGDRRECKELIAVKNFSTDVASEPVIESVTLVGDGQTVFSFTPSEEEACPASVGSSVVEGDYLYEPYPSMMKAGAPKLLVARYGLTTFHNNTRLYHSPEQIDGFPGEVFKVQRVIAYSSGNIKRFRREYPAISVATRNFGMSADALRAKLGVRDGGDLRLIALTDHNGNRQMLVVKPVD